MASSGSIWVSLGLKTDNFAKGLKGAKGQLTGFQKGMAGLKGMFNPFTIGLAAVAGLGAAFTDAIRIAVEFEKANSKLEAVLGATDSQMASLSKQAKELGSSTAFTASQVTELQTEFAKLGFPTSEIIQMTNATLAGAAALGSELGEQAALVGATMKQFGLDARDASKVNDILALSASKSALDFEKLSTAMPIVGATAATAGVSLERTTALLGILSDRGLDASSSGTALRNMFLELSQQGLTYEQAMAKINTATDKNAVALELFGKRGATAGVILAESSISLAEFEKKLNDSNGAAKLMSQTMLDNVAGDVTIAKSAWEGFVLSLEDGKGVISALSRQAVKLSSTYLSMLTALNNNDTAGVGIAWSKNLGIISDKAIEYNTINGKIVLSQEELVKASQNSAEAVAILKKQFNEGKINGAKFQQGIEMLAGGFKRLTAAQKEEKIQADSKRELEQKLLDETEALLADEAAFKGLTDAQKKAAAATAQMRKEQNDLANSFVNVQSKAAQVNSVIGSMQLDPIILDIRLPEQQTWQQMAAGMSASWEQMNLAAKQAELQKLQETAWAVGNATAQAFSGLGASVVASFGEATTGIDQFKMTMVQMAVDLIAQALSVSIANAIIAGSSSGAAAGPAAAFVTPALIATTVGSVIGAFAAIPAFADGGIVSGPTMGLMGEYSGARNNPEVIAPLDKLQAMISNTGGGMDGNVTFTIEGTTLVGVLKRTDKSMKYSN